MEALRKARGPNRRLFEKVEAELEKLLEETDKDCDKITAKFRELQTVHGDVIKADLKILDEMPKAELTEQEEDDEMSGISGYRSKMELMRVRVEKFNPDPLLPATESVNGSSSTEKSTSRKFKLPKIELQKFSGNMRDWLRFWAQFQKIDEDTEMMGSDKFWYLLQALQPGTEAHELVSAYPQSNENYPMAVAALKKRFGNDDMLLQIYIRELLTLVISNVNGKAKIPLPSLFMKIDGHLRALKTLNLERADPATWLFPLVESSIPEQVLYNWQRSPLSSHDGLKDDPPKTRLDMLMDFVEKEVDIQARMAITRNFGNNQRSVNVDKGHAPRERSQGERYSRDRERKLAPTTMGLHVGEGTPCLFCGKTNHQTRDCRKARFMTYDEKIQILKTTGMCFNCFMPHRASECRNKKRLRCEICGKGHYMAICKELSMFKKDENGADRKRVKVSEQRPLASIDCLGHVLKGVVFLQTILVRLIYEDKDIIVRAFFDSGSQQSYVLKHLATKLGLIPKAEEKVVHVVFGAKSGAPTRHLKYDLRVKGLRNDFQKTIEVRDQIRICGDVPRISRLDESIIQELKQKNVDLTDVGEGYQEIGLLIGSNVYGSLLTGQKVDMKNGMTALETHLGWTLSGTLTKDTEEENLAMMSIDMAINDSSITKLWELDILGIKETEQIQTVAEREKTVMDKFITGISRAKDGRYITRLPWKPDHPRLPSNRMVAFKRLESATRKLQKANLFHHYGDLFNSWEEEKFIEQAEPGIVGEDVHYLPHRAVIKTESLTTPVRPVFDASCKVSGFPSLNDCLEKGENYIKLIPEILARFREKKVGFVSDIRKAFQMIEVHPEDRDSLRFLWWKYIDKAEVLEYRHVRVPFGATCSPFILGAILKIHLENLDDRRQRVGKRLLDTFYVDNCCSSEDSIEEYHEFREISTDIMADAMMELRMWMSSAEECETENQTISVLGLKWDRKTDQLFVNVSGITYPEKITKRAVLSIAAKIFDPIGITSPAVLPLKLILQQSWIQKLKWDESLPQPEVELFTKWFNDVHLLAEIRVPRCLSGGNTNRNSWQIHAFSDGSKLGYGCVVYLRTAQSGSISVQLVCAKSRLAPIKKTTIPRLELLGCLIAARLVNAVKTSLDLEGVKCTYWSDSSTALAWIRRNDQWGTFVGRRTAEILKLTDTSDWCHVPGKVNPADLPSRGCAPAQLLKSRWWEGPSWLQEPAEQWPQEDERFNEETIMQERRKCLSVKVALSAVVLDFGKQYSFRTVVRIQGWVRRFIWNANPRNRDNRRKGNLSALECKAAENDVILRIQSESFSDGLEELQGLETLRDEKGVIKVKTRLTYRSDPVEFKYPAVLPGRHPLVQQLIMDYHIGYCHAGTGFLMAKLRSKYWILKCRRSIKKVISKCYRCRRYSAKPAVTETAPLPLDRIGDSNVFEVLGVDLAGPFFLKKQRKVWLVLYTCAVYRAVHIQTIDSLSTKAFIRGLSKFIERYGRPSIIYSDNGTNFRGADKLFKSLDWDQISKEDGISRIVWKFNPATASWWGGWWERLIRTVKDLLRKTIGNGTVTRVELEKLTKEVGNVMNQRPLTYVSEDPEDLEPLTPAMFLNPLAQMTFPEKDLSEGEKLRRRYEHMESLIKDLKKRFKYEYLGLMVSRNPKKTTKPLTVGELVIVGNDKEKRNLWPLGRVLDLIPGKDGVTRVARVKTKEGIYTRPVQRLFRLEAEDYAEVKKMQETVSTRSGRAVKKPIKFN